MSAFLIVLGLAVLVAFTGMGFLIAHSLIGSQMFMSLLRLTPLYVYVGAIGLCFLIGLLICIGLVMNALIYKRVNQIYERCGRRRHRGHRSQDVESEGEEE